MEQAMGLANSPTDSPSSIRLAFSWGAVLFSRQTMEPDTDSAKLRAQEGCEWETKAAVAVVSDAHFGGHFPRLRDQSLACGRGGGRALSALVSARPQ